MTDPEQWDHLMKLVEDKVSEERYKVTINVLQECLIGLYSYCEQLAVGIELLRQEIDQLKEVSNGSSS